MRGVVLFSHDNTEIDYGSLAMISACLIKKHMDVPVQLITDTRTWSNMSDYWGKRRDKVFERKPIFTDLPNDGNERRYTYKRNDRRKASYYNFDRSQVYELTPFRETMVIDLDYLVLDDLLNQVWGSPNELCMNHKVRSVTRPDQEDIQYVSDAFIPMYWTTVFYFRQTPQVEQFFKLVNHVKQDYRYFSMLYGFSPATYRNDVAFSIAAHIMSGYGQGHFIDDLHPDSLLFVWEPERVIDVHENGILFDSHHTDERKPILVKEQSVHVMNKISLLEHKKELVRNNE